jgi:hypothetical protein
LVTGGGDAVVGGDVVTGGGAAVVVGAGAGVLAGGGLAVVTGLAVVGVGAGAAAGATFFLCVTFFLCATFFLCVVFFCWCVVVVGVFTAACFCLAVCVLPELPHAASAMAATMDVTTVRFIGPPVGSLRTFAPPAMVADIRSAATWHPLVTFSREIATLSSAAKARERAAAAAVTMHATLQSVAAAGASRALTKSGTDYRRTSGRELDAPAR